MKNLWALRFVFVILAVWTMSVVFVIWAVIKFPWYALACMLVVIAASIIARPYIRRREERIRALVDEAFRRSYLALSSPPKLVRSSSYGYPAFEVTFESKAQIEAAAGLNERFREEIAMIFKSPRWLKGWGPFFRPFSVDQAITFAYPGWLDDLRANCSANDQSAEPPRSAPS